MELTSKFCLTPTQCYPVQTEVPGWVVLVLIGSSLFLAKEIYNLILN